MVDNILLALLTPIIELVANDMAAELMPAAVLAVVVIALSILPFDDGGDDVDANRNEKKKNKKIENDFLMNEQIKVMSDFNELDI